MNKFLLFIVGYFIGAFGVYNFGLKGTATTGWVLLAFLAFGAIINYAISDNETDDALHAVSEQGDKK